MKVSKLTVGVTTVAFSNNIKLVNHLKVLGFGRVKINEVKSRFSRIELIDFLKDCDVAIIGLDKVDDSLIKQLSKLKAISKYGVGLDNIDLEACNNRGVEVLYTQGVNKRSVSELALGSMLSLLRNIYLTSNELKNLKWIKNGGVQLTGKTVGIIGVGNIGKDLINLLKPFSCKILVNDILDQKDFYEDNSLIQVSKDILFAESDVISVHTPLTPDTANLFNKHVFDTMKSSSVMINTARGGIVNLTDLKEALNSGRIGGAAIDVYDQEPPEDEELLKIPNLINTPHIGGNATEAVEAMGHAAIENILNNYQ